jgi:TRAP-type transport system periplasmic protein
MRKLLLSFFTCAALGVTSMSYAQTFKIATLSPDGSFWTNTLKEAGKTIDEKTASRVQFRFYPGGVMGSDAAVLKKIRIGQLQGAMFTGGAIAPQAPDAQIYTIPLLFNSYAEVDYVRKKMDAEIEKSINSAGFVNFGLAEGGFAYVMSKKPIADANELKKHKVWAPSDDAAAQAAAETFQLSPVTLSMGDVLTGLQTDLINTITASPIAAIALQWHTQIKYVTDLPIAYFTVLMAIDQKAFAKISAADQKIVNDVMRAAFVKINNQNRIDNDNAFIALKKQGINMVQPTAEQLKVWRDKTQIAGKIFATKGKITPAHQQRVNTLLAEFRKNAAAAQ